MSKEASLCRGLLCSHLSPQSSILSEGSEGKEDPSLSSVLVQTESGQTMQRASTHLTEQETEVLRGEHGP